MAKVAHLLQQGNVNMKNQHHSSVPFRNLFPGFGIAVVAFTGYVIYDETAKAAKAKVEASRQGMEGTH
ncbi:hypothetical protein MVLG_02097 [Microbotryum lychnidis-dioicae p1A1 Lamole]|uniref:Uncharacterized protein n=1 Tax=Microbotryum lychnidis-dioicae (strain p1A1 Lamole / MvSl-1064) TaxID=683840 RepID=U5H449_USTV1|nr:hypothetical protein MVLG_02097 [Microbotryum lychnidis-dioicae p1A1 Lamole]|eukprot:KDE07634.1 hypothetical protein MVLG_02097 [Microbotryum lychnidis-dioicae p1A1 Lamole]